MDFLPDTDVSVRVLFEVRGQPQVPDANSVKYTLRSDAGGVLLSDQAVSVGAGANYAIITIPAARNAITSRYESRTLLVTYAINGAYYSTVCRYRLVPFLNTEVSVDTVRNALGVSASDLPNEGIDIASAYFDIEMVVTADVLDAALAGTPAQRRAATNAIMATAAIACIPSMKLRIAQSQADGPIKFSRFAKGIDWTQLRRELEDLRSAALDVLITRDGVDPVLLILVTPTDAITGE